MVPAPPGKWRSSSLGGASSLARCRETRWPEAERRATEAAQPPSADRPRTGAGSTKHLASHKWTSSRISKLPTYISSPPCRKMSITHNHHPNYKKTRARRYPGLVHDQDFKRDSVQQLWRPMDWDGGVDPPGVGYKGPPCCSSGWFLFRRLDGATAGGCWQQQGTQSAKLVIPTAIAHHSVHFIHLHQTFFKLQLAFSLSLYTHYLPKQNLARVY